MAVTNTNLYRAINKNDWPEDKPLARDGVAATGVLYPQFETKRFKSRGVWRERAPDVTVRTERGRNVVGTHEGTSLFDKADVFGTAWWHSFWIPEGTEIPDSLIVHKGAYHADKNATHYQIEVRTGTMEVDALKGALDNLARNAIVRSIELA